MKNIVLISSILVAALFLNSCSDSFLESTPSTQLPGDKSYTKETITSAMVAAYQPLQWFDLWMPIPFVAEAMGDDIGIGGGGLSDQDALHEISRYQARAVNHPTAIWRSCYTGIFRANIVIKNTPNIDMDETLKARLMAEAYALRTYYYYQVWRFYGNIPYFDNNPTDIVNEWKDIKQFSKNEIYEKLIVDIDKAIEGTALPISVIASEKGRITRGAALMIKANVVLMQEDASKYSTVADNMIEIIRSHGYTLVSDYASIWEDAGEWGSESIFEINYQDAGSSRGWGGDYPNDAPGGTVFPTMIGVNGFSDNTFAAGWGFMPMMPNLYKAFDDKDQRKNASILSFEYYKKNVNTAATYDTTRWDNTGYFNKKYLPRKGGNSGAPAGQGDLNYRNNLRVYRLSDTYLIAAELLVRTGRDQGLANEYLNEVRGRAFKYTGDYRLTATLDNILAERRLEFSGEGHRFFDLVRFGKANTISKSMQIGWENVGENQRRRTYSTYTYNPAYRYFPIPQSEVDKSLGSLDQNIGYD